MNNERIDELLNMEFESIDNCINTCYNYLSDYAIDGVKNYIGGPFGACVIQVLKDKKNAKKYKVISYGRNTVISSKDVTSHAEINAIRSACQILNRFDLSDCILISSAKSCPMCLSASCWANIKVIYYGEDYSSADASGFKDSTITDYISGKNNDIITEIHKPNEVCQKPFKEWNELENKIIY